MEIRSNAASEQRLLLLVNREAHESRSIAATASRGGWRTICIPDPADARSMLEGVEGQHFSAALIDYSTVGENGSATITRLKQRRPSLPIVVLTTSLDASHAVEAMRAGANDYLLKPFTADRLLGALRNAANAHSVPNELQPLSEKLDTSISFETMIGADPAFRNALAHAALAARGHGNILTEGEGGTGKTMLMRAIHAASPRARGPLKVIDARSFTEAGLMSALFGHEKGAFPGAFERKIGALQQCDGGTLFIRELSRLPRRVQDRLATTLAESRVQANGADYKYKINVRILSASNQALSPLVDEGVFDRSLYQALSPTRIELPPLRRRSDDVAALARHFVSSIREQTRSDISINADALELLCTFDWPGNVRQLQSVILRASAVCDGPAITAKHLPALAQTVGESQAMGHTRKPAREQFEVSLYTAEGHLRPLQEIEADVIRFAIGHYNGRMSEVARRLGVGRSTIYRRLKELGIDPWLDGSIKSDR